MDTLCPRCWGAKRDPNALGSCGYCHGSGVVIDRQLSPHFKLSELLYSQTAVRRGIANDPTDIFIGRLIEVCNDLLEPIRTQFGPIHIDSGLRLPQLNRALSGASTTSAHSLGWAADFIPISHDVSLKDIIEWIIGSGLSYDQVIYEGTWIHIARHNTLNQSRRMPLMAFASAGTMQYSLYVASDPRVL